MFLDTNLVVHKLVVVEFYINLVVLEVSLATSIAKGVEIMFHKVKLGENLQNSFGGVDKI